jgi:signal transduction histidine kinase
VVCAPLALLWWRPLVATVVFWCGVATYSRLVAPLDGSLSGTALVLSAAFAVAALSTRRVAVAGLVACWVGQLVGVGAADPLGEATMVSVCWLGGLVVNEASRLVELGRDNNRLLAEQDAVARQRAVVEERLRYARELHDQIGHSLTVVALQAGAARRLQVTDPARSREVLATIARAARDGLSAMQGDALADLGALLRRTRAAGLEVVADIEDFDAPGFLGQQERALACRIVQEALTNVLRHAPGARATVRLRREDEGATVEVRNTAAGPGGGAGSRLGLTGLRDLVAIRSGELRWGPCEDGGFVVWASIPTRQIAGALR